MKNGFRIAALAAALFAAGAALAQPDFRRDRDRDYGRDRDGEVILYDRQDFRGRIGTLDDPHPNFGLAGINDRIASMVVRGRAWEFCTNARFRGECRVYPPGEYRSLPDGHDDAYSSARPVGQRGDRPGGYDRPGRDGPGYGRDRLVLFDRAEFTGNPIEIDGTVPNLERIGFNDRAWSVIVERGHWLLCSDAGGNGFCADFPPGRYPSLPPQLQGRLSSVRVR